MAYAHARYVQLKLFETLTGYSPKAAQHKIANFVWREGKEFRRAPDGHILIDMEGFQKWVENQKAAA